METREEIEVAEGRAPRWQIWAMLLVLLGCIATVAGTIYDIR
jgi:hypothetical protein